MLALIFSDQASAQCPGSSSSNAAKIERWLCSSEAGPSGVLLSFRLPMRLTRAASSHSLHLHTPPSPSTSRDRGESAPPSLQYDCFPGTTLTKNLAQKSRKRKSEGKHRRTRFPQSAIFCRLTPNLYTTQLMRRTPQRAETEKSTHVLR